MEFVLLSLFVLAGTVATGVYFVKRELPLRRAAKEQWRAERAKKALEIWNLQRAAEEARRAQVELRAQKERERLAQLEQQRQQKEERAAFVSEKMAAREEAIRDREKRKEARAEKMRQWQERREQHIAGKTKDEEPT